jgi:hypothetical protein
MTDGMLMSSRTCLRRLLSTGELVIQACGFAIRKFRVAGVESTYLMDFVRMLFCESINRLDMRSGRFELLW